MGGISIIICGPCKHGLDLGDCGECHYGIKPPPPRRPRPPMPSGTKRPPKEG